MNRSEPLTDELIQAMFERRAERAAVGSLGEEILAATASTRQRSVLGLRLAGAWPRLNSRPAWIALAVLAALLGVVLALALSGHRQPGPLQTGLLAFIRAGDVYLADPDGSNARVVLHQDGATFATTAWAPGGDRLAVDGDAGVVVLDAATGGTTRIGGSNPVWSPDGQELATIDPPGATVRPDGPHLRIVEMATGATSHDYPFPAIGGLAWSPNGRWIAATGGTSGAANALARIDVTTGQWVEIDGASGMLDSERQPAWSPDSLHIAFIRWGAEGVANCHGSPLCETDVFVANPDGSNPVRLNGVAGKADQPAWSPDGRWIAYRAADRQTRQNGNGVSIAAAGTGIVIVRPDGTGERTIAADGVEAFAWGPESDRVRYLSVAAGQSVETLWDAPLDGAAHQVDVALGVPPHQFERSGGWFAWQTMASDRAIPPLPSVTQPAPTAAAVVVTPPSASPVDPSGTWPTLGTEGDDGCQPMTIATATGAVTTLAKLCDDVLRVDTWGWSPTGSACAVVRGGTLTIVQPDGRVAMNVAKLTGLNSLTWSPDGIWLTAATGSKTWVLHPDGSGLREIPGQPSWSADSRTLAVGTPDGKLLVGGPAGPDFHAIGAFPAYVSWSPDGSRFAFIRDGDAWTASRDGTDLRNLTSLPLGGAGSVAWSADGRWIAVGATHGLWLVPSDGGAMHWFDLGLGESLYDVHWAPLGGRLAVQTYTDGSASVGQQAIVYLVDPEGTPTIRLEDLATPSWSPDGRFLAGARVRSGSDPRAVVLMNADGSGQRELPGSSGLDPVAWVR